MDTRTAFGLMDVIVFGGGLYLLYAWYLLAFKGELKEGVLLPKDYDLRKIRDAEGYKKMMNMPTLFLAVSATLSGGLALYRDYFGGIPEALYWTVYGLFFVALIVFIVFSRKGQKGCL